MSILSKVKDWFVGSPEPDTKPHAEPHASRHDRREAGRERHHKTGKPAWDAGDKVGGGALRADQEPRRGARDPRRRLSPRSAAQNDGHALIRRLIRAR